MRLFLRPGTRAWALVAVCLWLVGFDLLPMAHLVFHDALGDHQHGPQHSHRHEEHQDDSVDHHAHKSSAHHHEHSHHGEAQAPHSNARGVPLAGQLPASPSHDQKHGEGSVAHRDLAAQVAPPPLPQVPETRLAYEAQRACAFDDDPSRVRTRTTRARAPPLA